VRLGPIYNGPKVRLGFSDVHSGTGGSNFPVDCLGRLEKGLAWTLEVGPSEFDTLFGSAKVCGNSQDSDVTPTQGRAPKPALLFVG
jgi:hypothetical protein